MSLVLKRLSLGLALLVLASAGLLVSGGGRSHGGPGRKWNVHIIEYNDVLDVKETEEGILAGLREAGLVEGRDYELHVSNAQGDMATVSALVDSAVTQGADLLITLSTPTLQAAIRRGKGKPVIYAYVASGIAAGAGTSDTDHLPQVTGVTIVAGYAQMVALVREHFPQIRRVGSLFVPAETNMVFHRQQLEEAAGKAGLEVVVVPVSTATDVPDAAQALVGRGIDAVMQMPGNLVASAFGSIARAASQAHLPVFAFQKAQLEQGAMVVVAREYFDSGRMAASLAARVMRGESPAHIPLQNFTRTRLLLNPEAARAAGISLPPALVKQAEQETATRDGNH
ncbi:MAG TPA: ABC transporter substrate-binding protein [Burkholderiales bacterium]|nr:ABC transporter substrate-binding protein [Burkholderiales bacterium]